MDTEVRKRYSGAAEHNIYRRVHFEERRGNIHWHLESIKDLLPDGGRAVDLGCGKGPGTVNLASRGFSVVAIDTDILNVSLPYATARTIAFGVKSVNYVRADKDTTLSYPLEGNVLYVRGDIKMSLSLPDDSADLVTLFHVDPTFPEDGLEICKEGVRVLKTDGLFVLTVDREKSLNPIQEMMKQVGLSEIFVSETPGLVGSYPDIVDKYLLVAKK